MRYAIATPGSVGVQPKALKACPECGTPRWLWRRKSLIAGLVTLILVVGIGFALGQLDSVRYQYMDQRLGSYTMLVRVNRFTGETFVLYPTEINRGWRRVSR